MRRYKRQSGILNVPGRREGPHLFVSPVYHARQERTVAALKAEPRRWPEWADGVDDGDMRWGPNLPTALVRWLIGFRHPRTGLYPPEHKTWWGGLITRTFMVAFLTLVACVPLALLGLVSYKLFGWPWFMAPSS